MALVAPDFRPADDSQLPGAGPLSALLVRQRLTTRTSVQATSLRPVVPLRPTHLGQVTPRANARVDSGFESVFATTSMARRLCLDVRTRRDSTGQCVPEGALACTSTRLADGKDPGVRENALAGARSALRSHRRSRRFKSGHLHQKIAGQASLTRCWRIQCQSGVRVRWLRSRGEVPLPCISSKGLGAF